MEAIQLCLLKKKVHMYGLFFKGKFCNEAKWMFLPPTSGAQALGILNLLFTSASAECTGIS
jgi:hypothetical protein